MEENQIVTNIIIELSKYNLATLTLESKYRLLKFLIDSFLEPSCEPDYDKL